jgi:hypothetical protein
MIQNTIVPALEDNYISPDLAIHTMGKNVFDFGVGLL